MHSTRGVEVMLGLRCLTRIEAATIYVVRNNFLPDYPFIDVIPV